GWLRPPRSIHCGNSAGVTSLGLPSVSEGGVPHAHDLKAIAILARCWRGTPTWTSARSTAPYVVARRYPDDVTSDHRRRRRGPTGPGRRPGRDRHGRGMRGRLVPASVPLARTRAEIFDDLVLDTVE